MLAAAAFDAAMRRRFGPDWRVRELRLQEDAQLRNASSRHMDSSGQRNDAHVIFNINGSYQLGWTEPSAEPGTVAQLDVPAGSALVLPHARSRRCRSARGGT